MKRRRTTRRPSVVPHECVVLAVDPGGTAGWAIYQRGRLAKLGTVSGFDLRGVSETVDDARALAEEHDLPIVLVGEAWTAGGWKSLERYGRMCESWGAWEAVGLDRGALVLRVYVQTWRGAILHTRQRPSAGWKRLARETVRALHRVDVRDDEAEAVLIGMYASYAQETRALLAKARKVATT